MAKRSSGKWKRRAKIAGLAGIAIATLGLASCIEVSGGTWMFHSAATPEGWPELTPIGEVRVREYPMYRAAVVEQDEANDGRVGPMFRNLFKHISRNGIAMTAPVDMGAVDRDDGGRTMTSMAFLYRTPDLGEVGQDAEDEAVRVIDIEPTTFASVGVRGDYNKKNYNRGLDTLTAWLEDQRKWEQIGPPRYLGYNGPFVPWPARYGEVQVPVRPADHTDGGSTSTGTRPGSGSTHSGTRPRPRRSPRHHR